MPSTRESLSTTSLSAYTPAISAGVRGPTHAVGGRATRGVPIGGDEGHGVGLVHGVGGGQGVADALERHRRAALDEDAQRLRRPPGTGGAGTGVNTALSIPLRT